MTSLTRGQIMMVVNRYIGVSGGYLGDFSYRTHAEFYPEYCDLDIDPYEITGTTRERFIEILASATPTHQAQILRGVLDRFPVEADDRPSTRTPGLLASIEEMIATLHDGPTIESPSVATQAGMVERALRDAEVLIEKSGAPSAVDRVHAALHGYLQALCADSGIAVDEDASLTAIFKALRRGHTALVATGPRHGDIDKILRSFASVLDALNPIRNRASLAHPQPSLLERPEAMLVIHATRTMLHYLNARMGLDSEAAEPGPST